MAPQQRRKEFATKTSSSKREMKGKSSHQPHFIGTLLPGFSHKISIPSGFLKYMAGEKCDKAILMSSRGKWNVDVKIDIGGSLCLDGLQDFIKAHHLSQETTLVFRYEGNMVFYVIMFDENLCEKEYSISVKSGRRIPLHVKKVGKRSEGSREIKVENGVHDSTRNIRSSKNMGRDGKLKKRPRVPQFKATIKRSNLITDYMSSVTWDSWGNVRDSSASPSSKPTTSYPGHRKRDESGNDSRGAGPDGS
ncbi:putative B3 domain-containing protein Os04g0347400 isoform X2 [Tasmannia lanceolata]|uniref:putative B3 domain-containing protein Os04g0347400 isoform X2 n=1 Tax=Tasmannia lanceolata TaxID=3420 RepID=UPI004062C7E2